jgi:hypothetical protein
MRLIEDQHPDLQGVLPRNIYQASNLREFEIILHGREVKNKKSKQAKYLSDRGFFPKH